MDKMSAAEPKYSWEITIAVKAIRELLPELYTLSRCRVKDIPSEPLCVCVYEPVWPSGKALGW